MSRLRIDISMALSVIAFLIVSSRCALSLETFRADLSGVNEVPPNGSPATGVAYIIIDTAANTLSYHISYSGLSAAETAAHIHGFSAPGVNSGVLTALPATNPKIGTWSYLEAQEANILSGLTYVNIHTTAAPGGEIRGQILPDASIQLVARVEGAQEVPPNGSAGLGIAFFTIDPVANLLSYDIRFGSLTGTETAAHIHGFAPPGVNAGVVHTLPAGSPKIGAWAYSEAQETDILNGLTYVNIHTTTAPGGEVRGQVLNLVGPTDVALPGTASDATMELRAFPNPVRGNSTAFYYRTATPAPVTLEVLDVQGRVVRHVYHAETGGSGVVAWDTRDDAGREVATGIYFARVVSGNETRSGRVAVLR